MMLSRSPMRLGRLFMLIGRSFVHFLWHEIAPLGWGNIDV
jgi:hypothetical protein